MILYINVIEMALKPFLKEEIKRAWLHFLISMLDGVSIPHDLIFMGMSNIIHIDEKWLYMIEKFEDYYLLPNERIQYAFAKTRISLEKSCF